MNPGILAAIAAIGVFCLTLGLSYPLLALILDSMGIGTALIGLNAAMTPLGIIFCLLGVAALSMPLSRKSSIQTFDISRFFR